MAQKGTESNAAWTETTAPWGTRYRWRIYLDRVSPDYWSRREEPHGLYHPPGPGFELEYWSEIDEGWRDARNVSRRSMLWDHLVRERRIPDEHRAREPGRRVR